MPVNIYSVCIDGRKSVEVAWLCDDIWEMPVQIEALEKWLATNRTKLSPGRYVVDIGFSPRPGASGGGGVITTPMMEAMVELGIELFISEYPPFVEEPQPTLQADGPAFGGSAA